MTGLALENLINICSFKKSFNESEHPRDEKGRFTNGGNTNSKSKDIENIKAGIKQLFEDEAIPLPDIPFTRDNYNKLFPLGIIETPIGTVKLGEHQFEKLQSLNRDYLLGAVSETLKNPLAVILEDRDNKKSKLYIKSFIDKDKNKQRIVQSVVVGIDDENISVSTHERTINNVVNKIKTADSLIYVDKKASRMIKHMHKNCTEMVNPTRQLRIKPSTLRLSINKNNKKSRPNEDINNVVNKIKTVNSLIYTSKRVNRMTKQASSKLDGSVVSPTMTKGQTPYHAHSSSHNFPLKSSLKDIKMFNSMLIKSNQDRKSTFEAIKSKVLSHLESLEEEEKRTLNKAFTFALLGKGGRGLPVGTIREWKGKKFIKIAPGKWRPKYDSHTKGAKLAISALKKKIVACKDEHEMMQIILENRDRFTDSRGNPLPFVQELYQFIREEQNSERRISPEEAQKNRSEAMKGNQNAKKDGVIEEERNGKDNTGNKRDELSDSTRKIRSRRSKGSSNKDVQGGELGDNGSTFTQLSSESGIRFEGAGASSERETRGTGRHKLDLEERLNKKSAKEIRKACLALLASKSDDEMTEEDKVLLRRYEGAGGLNEKGASSKGVLTEFYTPRNVIKKVWELVDKYIPNKNKKVLEPSSGIGRFAEGRDDNFTLCEIDGTSSRIARILHPKAEVKEGAFQNLFIKNNSVNKKYEGEKYDVVIGNPPYGTYNDYYKGLGEGTIHDRYEQYFIDRGLDTLKDGGIMAFVVPSGFLRGTSSKGKEAISKKGKLLEAWRLPKGTFSSTDVGTDIVIIKKGKGNIEDFTNNKYFLENESHIIGHEEDGGNWGTKIVKLPDGKTIEEAIAMIDIQATKVETEIEEAKQKTEVKTTPFMQELLVTNDTKSAEEEHRNRSEAMMGNQNAKKDFHKEKETKKKVKKGELFESSIGKNMTADEFNKKYNKNISEMDIKFWKQTDWDGVVRAKKQDDIFELRGENSRFVYDFEKGGFVHEINYASGNIYKKLEELDERDPDIERKRKILLDVLPTPKKLGEFTLSPLENFANKKGNDGLSLVDKFLEYCNCTNMRATRSIPYILSGDVVGDVSMIDVWEYIKRIPVKAERAYSIEEKEMAKLEAEKKKQDRKTTAERMFNTWLNNLSNEEKEKIENNWNRISNAFVNPDYTKIPLFVEGMNTHKGSDEFTLTEQQVKGVSQLCNKGNGILAYDVGVGKTVTGLIATVNQMQTGKSKRPLICVPKSVYKNWIASAKQHFPDVKINELSNFNEKDLSEYMNDGKLKLPENAINICTYEALQKITFKPETISTELRDDMLESQTIYDYDSNGKLLPDTRSQRQKEKDMEKLEKLLGMSAKAKDGAVFFEDLGIDHITVDELHNFKNIFMIPKVRSQSVRLEDEEEKTERLANEYTGVQSGAQSGRGMKLFAISQLIQKKTNGKGFFGLSATPFNNSPVEIYNILSLTARNRLKELNIYNLQDFMCQFAELKNDWKVDAKGDVKSEQVMKNFKNLGALQRLITEYIDKVDGEEAGVIRPYKRVHKPMLDLTPLQKAIIKAETDRMNGAFSSESDKGSKGQVLVAMNNMRLATLSPSLIDPKFYKDYEKYEGFYTPKVEDIVKESPKLQFVCDTTATQYNKRPKEGQVIYMPYGVEHFSQVKAYLVSKGMPENSIAFMDAKTASDKKEAIMSDFNDPEGKIKVIIGSGTIKEGVNLNGNTTTIYNTMLGWNPTETTQVEGRIWRQGNKQGVTHVVYPLMNDSIDAMMYQKYDEKSSRLNALWSYKGDSLNVEDIDPEELKFELIKDPEKRANLRILQEKTGLESEAKLLEHKIDSLYYTRNRLQSIKNEIKDYERAEKDLSYSISSNITRAKELKQELKEAEKKLKKDPKNSDLQSEIRQLEYRIELYLDNSLLERKIKECQKELKAFKKEVKGLTDTLERQGLNNYDDIEVKAKTLREQRNKLIEDIKSIDDKKESYKKEAEENIKKEREAVVHDSIDNIVSHYVNAIATDLKSFDTVKQAIKEMRSYTSSQIQNIIDEVKKNGRATVGNDIFTQRDLKDLEHFKSRSINKAINYVLVKMGLKKSFNEGEHPRDEGGKFTYKGSSDKAENRQWYEKPATVNELLDFAERAINENTQEKLFVGLINEEVKERIKELTGLEAKSIIVESDALRHSLNKGEHNISIKDIRHMETVINEADNIRLSSKKHSGNTVIEFSKDINGQVTFIEEFRVKRGQLALVTCYRKKKEKPLVTVPMLHEDVSPRTNVQNRNNAQAEDIIKHDNKKSSLKKAFIEVFKFLGNDELEVV